MILLVLDCPFYLVSGLPLHPPLLSLAGPDRIQLGTGSPGYLATCYPWLNVSSPSSTLLSKWLGLCPGLHGLAPENKVLLSDSPTHTCYKLHIAFLSPLSHPPLESLHIIRQQAIEHIFYQGPAQSSQTFIST